MKWCFLFKKNKNTKVNSCQFGYNNINKNQNKNK